MPFPIGDLVQLLIFLIGIPAVVLQFISADVRRVAIKKLVRSREVMLGLGSVCVICIACLVLVTIKWANPDYLYPWMLIAVFVVIAVTIGLVIYRYGLREEIIGFIQQETAAEFSREKIPSHPKGLMELLQIGQRSESAPDRAVVLQALAGLTGTVLQNRAYCGDSLGDLIEGLVQILSAHPDNEDIPNYHAAGELLRDVVRGQQQEQIVTLVDQQHAVRALSVLGQTFLSEISSSVQTDYVIARYSGALELAASRYPDLVTDVTQALAEMGAVAVERDRFMFAVSALMGLLQAMDHAKDTSGDAQADLLGMLAHLWAGGETSREYARGQLPYIEPCLHEPIFEALEKARVHANETMRFDTADRLWEMMGDLSQ